MRLLDAGCDVEAFRVAGVDGFLKILRAASSWAVSGVVIFSAKEIPTTDPKTLLPRLLSTIESEQVDYQQVHVRRATLEDVFLQLTGRSLRE